MYVVIVDTTQIQPYIFGSNRLKENIGASYLVAQATTNWAENCLPTDMEKLYAGGGNFVALAEAEETAKAFVRNLSQKVLLEAPGLQLVMTYRKRWEREGEQKETLATAVTQTFAQLAQKKQARAHNEPLLGLSVTQMCRSTALPAVIQDEEEKPVSPAIWAKLEVNQLATKRLTKDIKPSGGFSYPRDFDDIGREKGEQSHIAIVHADGNGMGQKFIALNQEYANDPDDTGYKQAIQALSDNVNKAGLTALQATVDALQNRIARDEPVKKDAIRQRNAKGDMIAEVLLKQEKDTTYLPFRPLVFGGDDVTFVCDGRLGISLAIEYLKQFETQTKKILGETFTACAGVAIVKSHYPFARAYGLAEELCGKAKKYRVQNGLDGSCLDWHFALTGLAGDIGEIRRREYTTYQDLNKLTDENYRGEHLTLRPLTLNGNPKESHRSFNAIYKGAAAFQDLRLGENQEPQWSTRRNKVKALRDALREGPPAVHRFKTMYGLEKLPPIDQEKDNNFQAGGWWSDYCGYFDAIEMMDWYIPLEEQQA